MTSKKKSRDELEREWDILREIGWKMYSTCYKCNEVKFVRGKRKDRVICAECFFGETMKGR